MFLALFEPRMRCITLNVYLLMVVGVFGTRYHTPEDCPSDHIHHDLRRDFIAEYDIYDEFECMELCDEDEECMAYNVQLPEAICEFNNDRTNEYADEMVTKEGWTFYQKEDSEAESTTCEKNPIAGRKQRELTSRGEHIHVASRGTTWAWWGQDCYRKDDDRVYYIYDYNNRADFYTYENEEKFIANQNYKLQNIDSRYNGYATGSGWIVFDRKYWFREYNWRRLIIWDLDRWQIEASINFESLSNSGYGPSSSTCDYDWGGYSSLDLEADESGRIFMTYGDPRLECYTRIAEIDPFKYEIVKTYQVNGIRRDWGGSGFIIDGIFYLTDNYNSNPTWILAEWNFRNNTVHYRQQTANVQNSMVWPQPHGYNSHIHWNPVRQMLYASHNSQHYKSKPTFIDLP